jgi:hypothetical protein
MRWRDARERLRELTGYDIGTPEPIDGRRYWPVVRITQVIDRDGLRFEVWTPEDMSPVLREVFARQDVAAAMFLARMAGLARDPATYRPDPARRRAARRDLRRLRDAARAVLAGPASDYLCTGTERRAVETVADLDVDLDWLVPIPAHRPPDPYMQALSILVRAFREVRTLDGERMTPLAIALLLAACGVPLRGRSLRGFLRTIENIEP